MRAILIAMHSLASPVPPHPVFLRLLVAAAGCGKAAELETLSCEITVFDGQIVFDRATGG